jgi:hypothetical protein
VSGYWLGTNGSIRYFWNPPKRVSRPQCGAKCRDGHACRAPAVWDKLLDQPRNGRCRMHGGKSTGAHTVEGKARIAAAQRERWRLWREAKISFPNQKVIR